MQYGHDRLAATYSMVHVMSEVKPFNREARYVVLKISDLNKLRGGQTQALREEIARISRRLPKRECLVIESDWPEYEPAWKMIQQRTTGEGLAVAETMGYSVVGNRYMIALTQQEILEHSQSYAGCMFELVARSALDAQRLRADTAEAERDERKRKHLRSCQIAIGKSQLAKERQSKLAAAEQRIADLSVILSRIIEVQKTDYSIRGGLPHRWECLIAEAEAALNPNPEAESHELAKE